MTFSISGSHQHFINPEPITVKGIKRECPVLFRIFTNKQREVEEFVAVAGNKKGTALKTIYKKARQLETDKQWLGKVGNVRYILRNDPSTRRRRDRREANVDTILEKLAYDLFQELGRGLFLVPKSCLSYQPVKDPFSSKRVDPDNWVSDGTTETLRIMSRYVKGYSDLRSLFTKVDEIDDPIPFMDYIFNYHRPPEKILIPSGALVPLQGLMSLLAVGRCLADVDLLGGGGLNAGFVWVYDSEQSIIAARVVKIDPGYAFHFTNDNPQNACENWVVNTAKKLGSVRYHLEDLKDIQISTANHDAIVQWSSLTKGQKDEFLGALLNSSRYFATQILPTQSVSDNHSSKAVSSSSASSSRSSPIVEPKTMPHVQQVLNFLFYREGKFTHSEDAYLPEELSQTMQREMTDWVQWQLKIYEEPLRAFQAEYPEQLLRIKYIDEFGELPLPMSHETLPIREIFTELVLIEEDPSKLIEEAQPELRSPSSSSSSPAASSSAPLSRSKNSDISHFCGLELGHPKTIVKLEHLFDEGAKKVLLVGGAGTGKSTLCQKIAHDWASGRLFSQKFKTVYWISLSFLNHQKGNPIEQSIADAIAMHLLKTPELSPSVYQQINAKRSQILLIFDGFDEASPAIKEGLLPLFDDPHLHIFLSSRFGQIDFLPTQIDRRVESVGFHDEQLKSYAHQFFARRGSDESTETADRFLTSLHKQGHLAQLAKTPLYLQMFCVLWEKNRSSSTLTGLYHTLIHEMLSWQLSRLSVSLEDTAPILSALGTLAASLLMEGRQVISEPMLVKTLAPYRLTISSFVEMGIIKATNPDYRFSHLTFQEYLTAYHLSQLTTPEQKQFLSHDASNPSYQTVIVFFFGIIAKQHPEEINSLFEALGMIEDRVELIFRCLNECKGQIEAFLAIEQLLSEHPQITNEYITIKDKNQLLTHHLIVQNQIDALAWLLRTKPELINQTDRNELSLLMMAALNGNVDVMELLISQPEGAALIHRFKKNGWTPLHSAAQEGHISAMEWLCNRDPTLISRFTNDEVTPLHAAAYNGCIPAMEWLCNRDSTLISRFMADGFTPLHAAAQEGHIPAMDWLCHHDSTLISRFMNDGSTPLHSAAIGGHITAMDWFCNRDSTLISRFTNDGATPLHLAAVMGHIPAMEWLVNRSSTLLERKYNGKTPYDCAKGWNDGAAQWLAEQMRVRGIDPNQNPNESKCLIS